MAVGRKLTLLNDAAVELESFTFGLEGKGTGSNGLKEGVGSSGLAGSVFDMALA